MKCEDKKLGSTSEHIVKVKGDDNAFVRMTMKDGKPVSTVMFFTDGRPEKTFNFVKTLTEKK